MGEWPGRKARKPLFSGFEEWIGRVAWESSLGEQIVKGALRFWDYNEKQGLSFKKIQSVHFRQCVKQPGRAQLELRITIRNKVIFTKNSKCAF